MSTNPDEKILLPHHEQQELCTTRLPYRQGRKLTAVKTYTINNESNHLLIFNVPSINLRQETKHLFMKFGKLTSFTVSPKHITEPFTETYHAVYNDIQSARMAKKMLDTKNFYGGSLHVCYAPEFESIEQTRQKLLKRKHDVLARLYNLEKDTERSLRNNEVKERNGNVPNDNLQDNLNRMVDNSDKNTRSKEDNMDNRIDRPKLNMGEINIINTGKSNYKRRKTDKSVVIEKKFKPCFTENKVEIGESSKTRLNQDDNIEIVDITSVDKDIVTNINEALNYDKFGNEDVRVIKTKPLNKIKFNGNKE